MTDNMIIKYTKITLKIRSLLAHEHILLRLVTLLQFPIGESKKNGGHNGTNSLASVLDAA